MKETAPSLSRQRASSPSDLAQGDKASEKDLPLVSVVIPARNEEGAIEHCLTSLRRQDYRRLQIIVVDNDSRDRTPRIATDLGATVVSAGPRPGIHRNLGVAHSEGRFLLYADADMVFEQGLVRECVELSLRYGYGALIISEISDGETYWGRVRAFERNLYMGDPIMESPRFIDRSWYERVGGFREALTGFEDMAMTNELVSHGCSIGRTRRRIRHSEGLLTLREAFGKKRFWGRHLPGYRSAYPEAYRKQASFRAAWTRRPAVLARHPLLALGLIPLKATDVLGLLVGSLEASPAAAENTPAESATSRSRRPVSKSIPLVSRWRYRSDGAPFGRMRTSVNLARSLGGSKILDVGCSNAWLAGALPGAQTFVGLDVAWENGFPPPTLPIVQGSAITLPFKSASFDTVTMFEVIEHVPAGTELAALKETRRVLKPGGTFLLSTPQDHPLGTYLDPAWWLRGHRHYRQEQLYRLVSRAGYEDIQLGPSGGLAQTLYLPLMYLFKRLGLRTPFEKAWRRAIDREYRSAGWYLIFLTARSRSPLQ